MLRTFIRTTTTPERGELLIAAVDLFEKAGYLNLVDTLEAVVAAEGQGTAEDVRQVFEQTLGDVFEAIYAAHNITIDYDRDMVGEITQHLRFLLWFNTADGYTPEAESEQELLEMGATPKLILDELYEQSGHNVSGEPTVWVVSVGMTFLQKLIDVVKGNNRLQENDVTLIDFDSQEDLKKFAAIYPDSLATKHIKLMEGRVCNINDLFARYDEEIIKLSAADLAVEVLGFAIISKNPDDVTNAVFAKRLIESAAGSGAKAMDVIAQLNKAIERVGLK